MADDVILESMNEVEARACLIAINGNLADAKLKALDFDRRLGWKALHYTSLAECFEAELGYSDKHGYRLRDAGKVEAAIVAHSPMGETVHLKERWVRDSGIKDLPPAQQAEAANLAKTIATTEATRMTTEHFTQAVTLIKTRQSVFASRYFVVSNLVVTGKITADKGREIEVELEKLLPKQRGYMLQLMVKFDLTCPALLKPIATMFDRKPGQESLVLPEVLKGFLGGTPLAKADGRDLARANAEAQKQHEAEALERERQRKLAAGEQVIEYVTLSLPVGDWGKCIEIIRRDLGDHAFEKLMEAGMKI